MIRMRYLNVAGESISVIGLGAWQFGSREWGYGPDYDTRVAPDIVERALELGINLFDTAEVYGSGRSEEILGRALTGRRDRAFIATKFMPVLPLPGRVERSARASLVRLGVDRIDLYQQHWPNPIFPMRFPVRGLRRVLDRALARHVGVSNHSLARWQKAERLLGRPILSNQVPFNLVQRRPRRRLVPWAAAHDRIVIAYSPLAQGLLSGKYHPGNPPTGSRARNPLNPLASATNLDRAAGLLEALREIGAGYGATPAQVALAWVISHPSTVAIPGARTAEQVSENAAAADLLLTSDELERLNETSARLNLLTVWRGALDAVRR